MSKTKAPKTPKTEKSKPMTTTKAAKKAKVVKAAPASEPAPPAPGECAKGGEHAWTEEDGERFCAKCKEPAPAAGKEPAPAKVKQVKATKTKAAKPAKEKRLSAIDAAAQVLAASKEPMNTKQMIEAMTVQALWTSPGGKTPHATLYSAIIREIALKGNESRFTKADRGKFAAK